jgi:hypothetical protein
VSDNDVIGLKNGGQLFQETGPMLPFCLWQQREGLFLAPGWLAGAPDCPGDSPFMISEHAEGIRQIAEESSDLPGIRTAIEKIPDCDQRIPRSKFDKTAKFLELDVTTVDVPDNNGAIKFAVYVSIGFHEQKCLSLLRRTAQITARMKCPTSIIEARFIFLYRLPESQEPLRELED